MTRNQRTEFMEITQPRLPPAVRLRGVSATLVHTDSHKQPIPLFPPQIRRGQGKWWMALPLGCQGLSVLCWIILQKPPCSSITPTPLLPKCDMHSLVRPFASTSLCEQMLGVSKEQEAQSAGTFPVCSRSRAKSTLLCVDAWTPVNWSYKTYLLALKVIKHKNKLARRPPSLTSFILIYFLLPASPPPLKSGGQQDIR